MYQHLFELPCHFFLCWYMLYCSMNTHYMAICFWSYSVIETSNIYFVMPETHVNCLFVAGINHFWWDPAKAVGIIFSGINLGIYLHHDRLIVYDTMKYNVTNIIFYVMDNFRSTQSWGYLCFQCNLHGNFSVCYECISSKTAVWIRLCFYIFFRIANHEILLENEQFWLSILDFYDSKSLSWFPLF